MFCLSSTEELKEINEDIRSIFNNSEKYSQLKKYKNNFISNILLNKDNSNNKKFPKNRNNNSNENEFNQESLTDTRSLKLNIDELNDNTNDKSLIDSSLTSSSSSSSPNLLISGKNNDYNKPNSKYIMKINKLKEIIRHYEVQKIQEACKYEKKILEITKKYDEEVLKNEELLLELKKVKDINSNNELIINDLNLRIETYILKYQNDIKNLATQLYDLEISLKKFFNSDMKDDNINISLLFSNLNNFINNNNSCLECNYLQEKNIRLTNKINDCNLKISELISEKEELLLEKENSKLIGNISDKKIIEPNNLNIEQNSSTESVNYNSNLSINTPNLLMLSSSPLKNGRFPSPINFARIGNSASPNKSYSNIEPSQNLGNSSANIPFIFGFNNSISKNNSLVKLLNNSPQKNLNDSCPIISLPPTPKSSNNTKKNTNNSSITTPSIHSNYSPTSTLNSNSSPSNNNSISSSSSNSPYNSSIWTNVNSPLSNLNNSEKRLDLNY